MSGMRLQILEVLATGAATMPYLCQSLGARHARARHVIGTRLYNLRCSGYVSRNAGRYSLTELGRAYIQQATALSIPAVVEPYPYQMRPAGLYALLLAALDDTPRSCRELWDDRAGITEAGIQLNPMPNSISAALWYMLHYGWVARVGHPRTYRYVITPAGRAARGDAPFEEAV